MRIAILAFALALAPAAAAQACPFTQQGEWTPSSGATTNLFRHTTIDAYYFVTTRMAIDADGAPNAYHPDNTGLDDNRNGGYRRNAEEKDASWWRSAIVPDPADNDQAYVQTTGTFAGYFVSKTTLAAPDLPDTDPAKYVDSNTVPYLAFPGGFAAMAGTGRIGDFGLAIRREDGAATPFIVADIAPTRAPLGEISIAMAKALGAPDPSPRKGPGVDLGEIAYLVFRNSGESPRWPVTPEAMKAKVEALAASVGGADAVRACIADLANR